MSLGYIASFISKNIHIKWLIISACHTMLQAGVRAFTCTRLERLSTFFYQRKSHFLHSINNNNESRKGAVTIELKVSKRVKQYSQPNQLAI